MSDKPFPCTIDGCTMTFTNEDHLNVHRKRHDMVLDLSIKNTVFSDETPTPTRFIRNCEEVGLFQDLQCTSINPFEETFKKALELSKTGSLEIPSINSDDTLHTPQIFPHITQDITPKKLTIDEDFNDELVIDITTRQPSPHINQDIKFEDEVVLSNKEIVITKLRKCLVAKPKLSSVPQTVKKLKLENNAQTKGNNKNPRTNNNINKFSIYDKNTPQDYKRREMNRMAQIRSRNKKKIHNQQYEGLMNNIKLENDKLLTENAQLKFQLKQLQLQLAKYKNCSCFKIEPVASPLEPVLLSKTTSVVPIAQPIQIIQFPVTAIFNHDSTLNSTHIAPKPIMPSKSDSNKSKK